MSGNTETTRTKIKYIEIDAEVIKAFQEAIATFAWNNDFYKFCKALELNTEYAHSLEMWQRFQKLNEGLGSLDAGVLATIVQAYYASKDKEIEESQITEETEI